MSDREKPLSAWDVTPTINTPAAEEVALYGTDIKVCGMCRYFESGESARENIRSQKFYERLVREERWQVKHLGSDPRTHGLCGRTNGETLTGAMHKACDGYVERRGLMSIRRSKDSP